MDVGWGDSVGEEGADSEESLCTGMIFFLTEELGSLFLIQPSIACNYHAVITHPANGLMPGRIKCTVGCNHE